VAWGFATPTARVVLAAGERLVVQRRSTVDTRRILGATRLLVGAGVPVPPVVLVIDRPDGAILVQGEIPGEPAAAAIGTVDGPVMAAGMGSLARQIAAVPGGPDDPAWATPDGFRTAAPGWLASLGQAMATATSSIDRVVRRGWSVGLSHGDFVPVNGLVERGRATAVVDLAEVARRHRLVDAAWWLLIVRHHHRGELAALAEPFLGAAFAGSERPSPSGLADVAVARAAELAARTAPGGRAHADAILRTAIDWAADLGDDAAV
jgi:Ser/Thr protein kinase RdoA (MazF antagonist)